MNFQDGIDCGGAYVKLLSKNDDLNLVSSHWEGRVKVRRASRSVYGGWGAGLPAAVSCMCISTCRGSSLPLVPGAENAAEMGRAIETRKVHLRHTGA